ncbi:MAG: DNA-processing protein DprA [Thermodesulfobacteriota bacterium]
MADLLDWLGLSLVPGLGPAGYHRLLERFGDPAAALVSRPQQRASISRLKIEMGQGVANRNRFRDLASEQLAALEQIGARVLCLDDPLYPESLRQISGAPPLIYLHGDISLLEKSSIAVVGSRAATSYGKRVAALLARGLVESGLNVVSGLAHGIDAEAHRGALSGCGATIGVLGCGLDVVYPKQNRALYSELRQRGLLVSEYPLTTQPDGFRFPARNRIIAGLSLGVVVVEAAARSGSLITASLALDEGREVFAVPGQVDSFKSKGTHWLLQQGAKLVQSVDDILEELQGVFGERCLTTPESTGVQGETADPETAALLGLIEPYPMDRDELIRRSGLAPGRVAELLLFLELEGLVEVQPGNKIRSIER